MIKAKQNLSISPHKATARVFMTALRAMSKDDQDSFLLALSRDKKFREDIIDLTIANKRSLEKEKPLHSFLKSQNKLPNK